MKIKDTIVFFDFDGVIVDSFNHAFTTNQKLEPNLTQEDYAARFNGNIMHHQAVKKWGKKFFKHYNKKAPKQPIFPGIVAVIETLAQEHTLIIVSASITETIKKLLDHHDLRKHFTGMLGSDVHASKHIKMQQALSENDVPATNAVMITDTLGDIREANETRIAAIGVTWGFHDEATLQEGNPRAIVSTPSELVGKVEEILTSL